MFWLDACEELSQGNVVMYSVPYTLLKGSRHKLFGGRKPARFREDGLAANIIKELAGIQWKDGWYAIKEKRIHNKDWKHLVIVQNKLNIKLLEKTGQFDTSREHYCGLEIVVFPDKEAEGGKSAEEIISRYDGEENYAIAFETPGMLPRAEITFRPWLYSEERLINGLKAAAEKHGYELEILPSMRVEERKRHKK